jgi:hypothetical protein
MSPRLSYNKPGDRKILLRTTVAECPPGAPFNEARLYFGTEQVYVVRSYMGTTRLLRELTF